MYPERVSPLTRFFLILLLSYLVYRLIRKIFREKSRVQSEVKGNADSNPLDLDDYEITDARYEDIDDSTKK